MYNRDQMRRKLERSVVVAGLRWICAVLLFCGFAARASAQAHNGRSGANVQISSIGLDSQFAIADFDGDHRPDLAYVQAGQSDAYWIAFHFSLQGPTALRILAPPGGLRIEARDVNGDHAVDLVVRTALLQQPVAVLLNDGHGSFRPAKPAAFPQAFQRGERNRLSSQRHLGSPLGAVTQSRVAAEIACQTTYETPQRRVSAPSNSAALPFSFRRLRFGRAPPIHS